MMNQRLDDLERALNVLTCRQGLVILNYRSDRYRPSCRNH